MEMAAGGDLFDKIGSSLRPEYEYSLWHVALTETWSQYRTSASTRTSRTSTSRRCSLALCVPPPPRRARCPPTRVDADRSFADVPSYRRGVSSGSQAREPVARCRGDAQDQRFWSVCGIQDRGKRQGQDAHAQRAMREPAVHRTRGRFPTRHNLS